MTRPSRKLADKYLGRFEIIGVAGPMSFVLRLPDGMRRVHPVWHVSQLEPAHDAHFEGHTQPPPPPIEVEGEAEHEVAGILDSKLDRHRKEPLVYLVKWTGYEGTPDESSWEPAEHLQHVPDLVHEFHRQHPDKPRLNMLFSLVVVLFTLDKIVEFFRHYLNILLFPLHLAFPLVLPCPPLRMRHARPFRDLRHARPVRDLHTRGHLGRRVLLRSAAPRPSLLFLPPRPRPRPRHCCCCPPLPHSPPHPLLTHHYVHCDVILLLLLVRLLILLIIGHRRRSRPRQARGARGQTVHRLPHPVHLIDEPAKQACVAVHRARDSLHPVTDCSRPRCDIGGWGGRYHRADV
jgi:hypothetical protein